MSEMRVIEKKGVIVFRNADGVAMVAFGGLSEYVEQWIAAQPFDWTTHHFHQVLYDEYVGYRAILHRVRKQAGKIVVVDPSAQEKRRKEYPPLQDQLEALWDAMDAGDLPKVKGFYDVIKKVKDKYPKTS